jgi:hypothetical protein
MKIVYRIMGTVLDGPMHTRVWRSITHMIVGTLDEAIYESNAWFAAQALNPLSGDAVIQPEVRL